MRSKLYLPSIVDVGSGVEAWQAVSQPVRMQRQLGFRAIFDFFIGFDECLASETRF